MDKREIMEAAKGMAQGVAIACMLAVLIAIPAVPVGYLLEREQCHAKTEGMFGVNGIAAVDYTFFGGCQIQFNDGYWVPLDNYRSVGR